MKYNDKFTKNGSMLAISVLVVLACLSCVSDSRYSKGVSGIEAEGGIIRLENPAMRMSIEQRGGSFVDLELKGCPVNPLSWALTPETMPKYSHEDAVFKGHFLCMGRSGAPSENEIAAGVPLRGEQTGRVWTITRLEEGGVNMQCDAPLDGLRVERLVRLDGNDSQFFVVERFVNTSPLGRVYNVLQHVTIGPPFLSEATLINSNARQGFFIKLAWPDPYKYEYEFPYARLNKTGSQTTDLRLTSDRVNYLSSHVFSDDDVYGWVTAYDPTTGVVLGYVWKTADYPWINIWNNWTDAGLAAKGLEFGTTGMDGTYRKLLESGRRFHGKNSWEYIDAGQTIEKSFMGFIVRIEKNAENPKLSIDDGKILLNGRIEIQNPFSAER